jgi:hypothetical protein
MFFHLLVRIEVLVLWPHYRDILGHHLSLSGAAQTAAAAAAAALGTDKACLRMHDSHSSGGFSLYIQFVHQLIPPPLY